MYAIKKCEMIFEKKKLIRTGGYIYTQINKCVYIPKLELDTQIRNKKVCIPELELGIYPNKKVCVPKLELDTKIKKCAYPN